MSWNIDNLAVGGTATLIIKVKAQNSGAISNTATVTVKEQDIALANNTSTVIIQVLKLQIPNVITPDGDGKNDSFKIVGLAAYPESKLTIVNRWGNEVWHSIGTTYKNEWTGQGLNEGTYYYVLQLNDSFYKAPFTGSISIIK